MGDPRREVPPSQNAAEPALPGRQRCPLGGSAKRCGGSPPHAYFSRIRVERSTSRKVSTSEFDVETASITEQAIMR